MTKRYFHASTLRNIEAMAHDLPHAVVLSGPKGIGLGVAARELIEQSGATLLHTEWPRKNDEPDPHGSIPVERIRYLYEVTSGASTSARVVVIKNAESMGSQAQNALLKLLEEPARNTHFILLTSTPSRLLPTIRSRVQEIEVKPITPKDSEKLLDEAGVKDSLKRTQLLFMAKGLPRELYKLIEDAEYFDARAQIIRDARTFIQGKAYDRLKLAQTYKDSRPNSLTLLVDAMNMLESGLLEGKAPYINKIESLLRAHDKIEANGNIRLQLAVAML